MIFHNSALSGGHKHEPGCTLGYLISVSVVWAILSVSDAKISTCTVSVSVWKKTIINVSVETKTVQSVIHS